MSAPDAFGANQTYDAERHAGSIGSFGVTSTPERYTSRGDDSAGANMPENREPIYINSDEENEEDNDIHPGDDGDDAMSIASSAMHSVTSSMSKEQLEAMVTNMFEVLMKKTTTAVAPVPQTPKRRTTAAAAGGAAGDEPPAPSPQKAAFLLEHDRVVAHTDEMCQAIQKLHQKELWWVQQWVNEAKLKYKTKTIRTYTDNVHRYNIKQAAGMRVMTRTAA